MACFYSPKYFDTHCVILQGKPVGSPNASTFFRMIEEHKVAGLATAPTTLRVIQSEVLLLRFQSIIGIEILSL